MATPTCTVDPHGAPAIQRIADHENPSLDDITIGQEESEEARSDSGMVRPPGRPTDNQAMPADRLNQAPVGTPLDAEARDMMETGFRADFSRVRIHADGPAADLARSLSARAFTHGPDIYFGTNEYRPATPEGRRVLAHELTHVVQQGAARSGLPVRQHVAGRSDSNARGMVQRLGAPGPATAQNVYPWDGTSPSGSNHNMSTDGGTQVTGWIAYSPWKPELHYWCHGHSLGTYQTYGYSVYSGSPLRTVIHDEWNSISPDQTQAGDIAVWTTGWNHSARFTTPVVQGGQLDSNLSMLSTKNGKNALTTMSLASIASMYGGAGIGMYRHR
ncbi:MAG: DUF4157 domain-containing protein [Pseudonocardiaceae bacterium]